MPRKQRAPDPRWQWKPKRRFRPLPTPKKRKGEVKIAICAGWYSNLRDSRACRRAGCKHPAHRVVRVRPRKPETKDQRIKTLRLIRAFVERRNAEEWKYPKLSDVK